MICCTKEDIDKLVNEFKDFDYTATTDNNKRIITVYSKLNNVVILIIDTREHHIQFITNPKDNHKYSTGFIGPTQTEMTIRHVGKIWFDGNLLYIDETVAINFIKEPLQGIIS